MRLILCCFLAGRTSDARPYGWRIFDSSVIYTMAIYRKPPQYIIGLVQ